MFDLNNIGALLNEGLNPATDFLTEENPEHDTLIAEQLISESLTPEEMEMFIESAEFQTLVNMGILNEKTIVRFDKHAKLSRSESQAILAIAREKGDRDFKKLVTVWKMRKMLLEKLAKKYGSQAKTRAKKMQRTIKSAPVSLAKKLK